MSRYVWLLETSGLTNDVEVYGTLRRAVAALVGVQVLDEAGRDAQLANRDEDNISRDTDGNVLDDAPTKPLTRPAIYAELRSNADGNFAHWSMDGAGDTFVSLARRRVR